MKVEVIGLGKAGLPLAAVVADAGLEVIGLDVNTNLIEKINDGITPFPEEPGLEELIKKYGGNRLKATNNPTMASKETTLHIILVPLLLNDSYGADFTYLDKAIHGVCSGLKKGDIVVIETTLPVGTTEQRIRKQIEKSGMIIGKEVFLAYSPERLMSGVAISRFKEFPKVIGGVDEKSGKIALDAYKRFIPQTTLVSSSRVAEMIKIAEGVYRDVNVALANELFKICVDNGLNFDEVRTYSNHKYCQIHEAGIGVGGHCIPVYPWFLINSSEGRGKKDHVKLIKSARLLNDDMVIYWKERILSEVKKIKKEKIKVCVVGVTYRAGVKEIYHSRAIPLIKQLKSGGLEVYAWDELLSKQEIENLGLQYLDPKQADYVFNTHVIQKEKWV